MKMKSIKRMTPTEVSGYIRDRIRYYLSDKIENRATVYARNGRYYVTLPKRRGWPRETWKLRRSASKQRPEMTVQEWDKLMGERGEAETY
jgi:hypothetical protein